MSSNLSPTEASATTTFDFLTEAMMKAYAEIELLKLDKSQLIQEKNELRLQNKKLQTTVEAQKSIIKIKTEDHTAAKRELQANCMACYNKGVAVKKELQQAEAKLEIATKETANPRIPEKYFKAMEQVESIKELLVCPISDERLINPVVCANGTVCSRHAVRAFVASKDSDPRMQQIFAVKDLRVAPLIQDILDKLRQ
jgi:regulator of replication initiation timing